MAKISVVCLTEQLLSWVSTHETEITITVNFVLNLSMRNIY